VKLNQKAGAFFSPRKKAIIKTKNSPRQIQGAEFALRLKPLIAEKAKEREHKGIQNSGDFIRTDKPLDSIDRPRIISHVNGR
jgi:hypothetical protein